MKKLLSTVITIGIIVVMVLTCPKEDEHFKAISGDNVVYDVVDSYTSLLEKVMK